MLELSPLSSTEKMVLVAVLATVMLIVVFIEMRYIRGKSKEIKHASQRKDEAYNAILTTRSVMNVMQRQGADVSKAQRILASAKSAMQRNEYDLCKELCEQARQELTNPTGEGTPKPAAGPEGERLERIAENILSAKEIPRDAENYAGSKLPVAQDGSYLSAKFEISAAKADIGRALSNGADVNAAQDLLTQAESALVTGAYMKALSYAVKARKAIGTEEDTIPLKSSPVQDEDEPDARPTPEEMSEPFSEECSSCGAPLDAGDAFCHKCGEKVLRERLCKVCGTKARPDDSFCRKCGAKVA